MPFCSGVSVNGNTVNIGSSKSAAIDTGTTLIGAPSAAVTAIWGAVPGAKPLSGQLAGFWAFRAYFPFSLDAVQ
jgi:cathepsin D